MVISTITDSGGVAYIGISVIASGKGPIPAVPAAGSSPAANYVYPVAGNGQAIVSGSCTDSSGIGDGCRAVDSPLGSLASIISFAPGPNIAIDAHGNIYIAAGLYQSPSGNPVGELRVIYASGSIPGLPSNPVPGNIYAVANQGGSQPVATGSAALNTFLLPISVAADPQGNVFVTASNDYNNYDVWLIPVRNQDFPGFMSNAQAGTAYVYLANGCSYTSSSCGVNGPVSAAMASEPVGVQFDPRGNLYLLDNQLRAVFAGGSLPGIASPVPGNIYLIAGGGTTTTFGGPAADFQFDSSSSAPDQVSFDPAGDVYIMDGQIVERVDPLGNINLTAGRASRDVSPVPCPASIDPNLTNDGCDAFTASLNGVTQDGAGDFVFASQPGYQKRLGGNAGLIQQDTVSSTTIDPLTSFVGTTVTGQFAVYNVDAKPLHFSSISISPGPFALASTGGSTDCSAITVLGPGETCQIGYIFTPSAKGDTLSAAISIASDSASATDGVNVAKVLGVGVQTQTFPSLTISPAYPSVVNPGQPVTFTANLVPALGTKATPTGTITFVDASNRTLAQADAYGCAHGRDRECHDQLGRRRKLPRDCAI